MLIAVYASDSVTVLYHHKWSNINGTGEANIRVLMPFSVLLECTLAPHPSQRMGGETELPALSFCVFLCVCTKAARMHEDGLTSKTTALFLNVQRRRQL